MKKRASGRYLKVVEWSDEDDCYIGTAPGLLIGGVHGKDQAKVFADLCDAIEGAIQILKKEGRPLPKSTMGRKYSGKILLRIPSELHKALAIKAVRAGESINKLIQHELETHLR